jgi:replicative DNA helicase
MVDGPEGRVPPNNLEAEASVLGGILLRNDALDAVLERGVEAEDFYHPAHRAIFEAMVELQGRQQPIDVITLADLLKGVEHGRRASVSEALLADLAARVPTAANVGHYARLVHEKSSLRRMIAACGEVTGKAFSDYGDTAQFLDWAEGRVFQVAQRTGRQSYVPIKQLLPETVKKIEQRYDQKRNVTGVPTEYHEFDRMTAGLQASDLIILAARPSMGKTALALNIAQNVAMVHKIPVLVFSLEMAKHSLVERMLCAEAHIDSRNLRTGYIQPQQWLDLTQAMAHLSEAPIAIDDSAASTALEIRAKARRWRADTSIFPDRNNRGFGLIVIDYLQLVRGRGDIDSREREISDISMGLKALAKELEVPVLALSQLNRGVEKRDDKRPLLSDLRESGALEQDADVIVFIYRDAVYQRRELRSGRETEPEDRTAEIIIGKQRNGPTGTITLTFMREFTRFENQSPRDEGYGPGQD